jgi:tetratricopeptide (TPR) repeat protein
MQLGTSVWLLISASVVTGAPQAAPAPNVETPPRLGIQFETVVPGLVRSYGLTSKQGVLVWEVTPGSTAELAGVKPGDIIVELAGQKVVTDNDVTAAVGRTALGSRLTLVVVRDGKRLELSATMRPLPPPGEPTGASPATPRLAFREAEPGVTKAVDLLKNPRWKPLVREDNRGDGSTQLEFQLPPWTRVVVTVRKDVVWAIDAVPPQGAAPQEIASVLQLGLLLPLDSVPAAARVGLPIAEAWKPSRCSQAAGVVVFTTELAGQPTVTLLRFYAQDHGDQANVLRWRAIHRARTGNIAEAIRDLSEAIRLDPKNTAHYLDRGMYYRRQGQLEQALADYDTAIRLNDKLAAAFNNRANLLGARGEHERALADYRRAIELDPKYVVARRNLGSTLIDLGRYDEAITVLDVAIRMSPDYCEPWFDRGWCYFQKGQYDLAIAACQEGLAADPQSEFVYHGHYFIGRALLAQGKREEALATFEESIRLNPKFPYGYRYRGEIFINQDKLDAAIEQLSTAIKLDPKLAVAYYLRGYAYHKTGDAERAAADHRQAATLDPQYADKPYE